MTSEKGFGSPAAGDTFSQEAHMNVIWKKHCSQGDEILLMTADDHSLAHGVIVGGQSLRCGDQSLRCGDQLVFSSGLVGLDSPIYLKKEVSLVLAWSGRVIKGDFKPGSEVISVTKQGFSLGWITLSDKGARGERVDMSGPAIVETVSSVLPICFSTGRIIPDEPALLKHALVEFCLGYQFDMVFTTGGTGVGPRDITPEVTASVLEKRLPGFERVMTQTSVAKTPHGMISRAVAGIMGLSVVVNLPGSPKAVRENVIALIPALQHTIEKLHGDQSDCAQ